MYRFHKRDRLWKKHQTMRIQNQLACSTYETDSLAENHGGGKFMENLDCTPNRCHDLVVASSEFAEGPRLLLKNLSDGIDRFAALELDGERMFNKVHPRLLFILLQSRLKK